MAAISTAIAVAGLGLAAAGTVGGFMAAGDQADAQQQALAAQRKAEMQRKKQMELDFARSRNRIIRESVAARSKSLSVATAQGASLGSALPGAYGGIAGRANSSLRDNAQNEQIGSKIFSLNAESGSAYARAAEYGADAAFYGGLTSLGGALVKNQATISRVGTYFGAPATPPQPSSA